MRLLCDLSEPPLKAAPITANSSLEFLQAIYSDPSQSISRRMRAAIAALPFEHPKLSVMSYTVANAAFQNLIGADGATPPSMHDLAMVYAKIAEKYFREIASDFESALFGWCPILADSDDCGRGFRLNAAMG